MDISKAIFMTQEEYDNAVSYSSLLTIKNSLRQLPYYKKLYKMYWKDDWFTRWDLANKAYRKWIYKKKYDPKALYFII